MSFFEALALAIIEGLTEFLPISSTAHMRILDMFFVNSNTNKEFRDFFIVGIQLGAILSVVFLYYKVFLKSFDFYIKLSIAVIPAIISGLLLKKQIESVLDNVVVIAWFLLIGGIVFLFIDNFFKDNNLENVEDITLKKAVTIGCFQCIALFPGISRSGASIIGGLTQKLTRKNAAEFSFFLAVPTMIAATTYKTFSFIKKGSGITQDEVKLLLFGNVVAFIVAILALKFFVGVVSKYGFKAFGWYRIVLGCLILGFYYLK